MKLRDKSRKKEGFLYKFLPWVGRRTTTLLNYTSRFYNGLFLSLSLSICPFELSLIPFLRGASLLYIVAGIASQPFTWIAANPYLDTCPIIALLVVVE